jgi:hypothetical protein
VNGELRRALQDRRPRQRLSDLISGTGANMESMGLIAAGWRRSGAISPRPPRLSGESKLGSPTRKSHRRILRRGGT